MDPTSGQWTNYLKESLGVQWVLIHVASLIFHNGAGELIVESHQNWKPTLKLHLAVNQALTLEVAAQVASPAAWPVAWPGRQDVVWELSPPPVPTRDQRQPTVSLEKDQIVETHKIFTGYSQDIHL